MARTGNWERAFNGSTALSTFDYLPMVVIGNGQTINRTFWSWSACLSASTSEGIPTGSSITRVGLITRPPGSTDIPRPITDAGADWMDLMTCRWTGNIATSTNVDWLLQAGFGGPDKVARAQRLAVSSEGLQLYVSWETWVAADAVGPFAFVANASTDCYVLDALSGATDAPTVRTSPVPRVPGGELPGVRAMALPEQRVRTQLR